MNSEVSSDEGARLAAILRYNILDTPPDGAFDRITAMAARLFGVPVAIVSIVDTDRIWFKSHHGLDVDELAREPGLCASAILQNEPWIVGDARLDPRALANSVVACETGFQFYAGVPLATHDGYNLGTICVLDYQPREVTADEVATLTDLAHLVMSELELRRAARKQHVTEEARRISVERLALTLEERLTAFSEVDAATNRIQGSLSELVLIDDDEGDAALVREMLTDGAVQAGLTWVRTIGEAHRVLGPTTGCVLLDLGPDATGWSGLDAVIAAAPGAAIIVLTGLTDDQIGLDGVARGAQDYLPKSNVDGQILARSIRYALERKDAERTGRLLVHSALRAEENARLSRGLLPTPLLRASDIVVTSRYQPGNSRALLGGDFFDVVEGLDGTLSVLIGDVSGHGPDEAALGVCLRVAWRTLVLAGAAQDTIFPLLSDLLVQERSGNEVFATACMLVIEADRTQATSWLAGHPPPLLIGKGPLDGNHCGPPLGIDGAEKAQPAKLELGNPPWSVLLYTDGIVEGLVNGGRERLGHDGLNTLLTQLVNEDPKPGIWLNQLVNRVEDLNGGPLTDDLAMLVVSSSPPR